MEVQESKQDQKTIRRFTLEEDERLGNLVNTFGENEWVKIANQMPGRDPDSCRRRYNDLVQRIPRKQAWATDEDNYIRQAVQVYSKNYLIEAQKVLTRRTKSEIKARCKQLERPGNQCYKKSQNLQNSRQIYGNEDIFLVDPILATTIG
jgi:hypothetical protein